MSERPLKSAACRTIHERSAGSSSGVMPEAADAGLPCGTRAHARAWRLAVAGCCPAPEVRGITSCPTAACKCPGVTCGSPRASHAERHAFRNRAVSENRRAANCSGYASRSLDMLVRREQIPIEPARPCEACSGPTHARRQQDDVPYTVSFRVIRARLRAASSLTASRAFTSKRARCDAPPPAASRVVVPAAIALLEAPLPSHITAMTQPG